MDKRTLAQGALEKRKQYDVLTRAPWDKAIHDAVLDRLEGHHVIALYAAFNHEVDTYGIMETLFWDAKYTLCLPKVEDHDMHFYKISNFNQLEPSKMGILEPITEERIDPHLIDVMIIPMLAFNQKGYRVGYGGGYYDRYLANTNPLKMGIAYSFQETHVDFQEMHDIPCDVIITDQHVINPNLI